MKHYIFPFGSVPQNSNVVLYGYGDIGKSFFAQLSATKYAKVVLWVDEDYEHLRCRGMKISSPSEIKNHEFDYLVVSCDDIETAERVYDELCASEIIQKPVILPQCEWKEEVEYKKIYKFEEFSGIVGVVNNAYWDNPGCLLSAYSIQEFIRKEFPSLAAICLYYEQGPISPADWRFIERHQKYEDFRKKHLLLTEKFTKFDSWPLKLDFTCCIATIDVWRPDLAKSNFSYFYFLKFLRESYKKIGFGVSLATDEETLLMPLKDKYKTLIHDFSAIYARENSAVDFLRQCSDAPVSKCLDACFFHDKGFYENVMTDDLVWEENNRYIYVYLLSPNQKPIQFAVREAKRLGIKIKYDVRFKKDIPLYSPFTKVDSFPEYASGPSEFLTNIKNAEYVITDSFHATVFSIIFHREFFVFPRGSINVRMLELMQALGLQRRFDCEEIYNEKIDYQKVDETLEILRKESAQALIGAVKNAIEKKSEEITLKDHVGRNNFCCGCNSCAQSCKVNAISMIRDAEGFIVPEIDESKCVSCGKCLSVCPVVCHDDARVAHSSISYYAGIHKSDETVSRSSSGGAFTALAEYVFSHKGIVYGCGWDGLVPRHMGIEKIDELDKLRLSKYIQSDTSNTYTEVKSYLEQGRMVMYVGTPCQIAGLRLFLGKGYSNLLCVDIICHGTPSYGMFEKHIKDLEAKEGISIERFEFRKKPFQETLERYKEKTQSLYYYYYYRDKNGEKKWREEQSLKDSYYAAFLKCENYNELCYKCPYAKRARPGDITIGDYRWAVDYHEDLKHKVGNRGYAVSCIIVNTKKGESLLDACGESIDLYRTKFNWIAKRNGQLLRPNMRPDNRSIY